MMMMQMSSSVASHKNMFQMGGRGSFKCQASSPLNPKLPCSPESVRLVTSSDATKLHLANLDKLLQNQNPHPLPLEEVDMIEKQAEAAALNKNEKKKSKSLFVEGLKLARVWTEGKASEEMSPGHLKRLQRLLSMSREYSPRNVLGSRWREYHGSNDWKGMLDPLDHNLRREVVRYGEFVQAVYHSFHDMTSSSSSDLVLPLPLPDRSYRVTKNLYATSSIALPGMGPRSSWVGYVAVCDDRREIARMGRRDIVISLRGTATCLEWAENMRAQLAPMDNDTDNAKVESGFLSLYRTRGEHVESLAESVREEVKRLKEMYKGETLSISVTGHSLGAALALLVADDISSASSDEDVAVAVAVFSFGGPRVGNKAFGERITRKKVKVLRIVNSQDVITRVPGILVSQELEQKLSNSDLGNMLMLGYSHVGSELRLHTNNSPYLKPHADMACCHDLEAYLHLVDGFFASDSPFRTNAKRSLATLLQHHPSNVNNLYTNIYKAKAKANASAKPKPLTLNIQRHPSFSMSTCMPSPS